MVFIPLEQKKNLNKDFCNIFMPSKDTKILEFNQYQKLIPKKPGI